MSSKRTPQRQCVGCREMKEKKELIRIIRTASGQIGLDHTGKADGRGAYLCRNRECLAKAKKTKGAERSLKMKIPDDIYEKLEKELEQSGI